MPFAVRLCYALRRPGPRDTLPDFQTFYFVLLAALILVWLGWQTHCTVRTFAAETTRLNAAVDAIAARQLEQIDTDGVRIREFAATLQALQTMGRELTDSLQPVADGAAAHRADRRIGP